jgi:hypothetical protein
VSFNTVGSQKLTPYSALSGKIVKRQQQHRWMPERRQPMAARQLNLAVLIVECGNQTVTFSRLQPVCIAWMVLDRPPPHRAPQQRRQRLDHEHRPPADEMQNQTGDGIGDRRADRQAHQKQRVGAGALGFGEPGADQHDRASQHATLSKTERKTVEDQFEIGRHEGCRQCDGAPQNELDGDDALSAPHAGEPSRRDLQHNITPGEEPTGEPDGRWRQTELAADRRRRHRDIDPVDIREHVHDKGDA